MSSKLVSSIALAACLLASGGAFAEVLYQQAPTADATGESANNPVVTGEPLLFQSIPSLGNVTLEKIVWWGYRNPAYDPNPYPGTVESFEVYLDGSVVAGNLTLDFGSNLPNTSRPLVRYTLDVADAPLTTTEIALANMNDDVSWFWQGAGLDAAGAPLLAFSLEGTRNGGVVPEPGTLALLGLAGLAARAASRKRG
ncbi:PEP-CTERM sorting domain-containing protein [Zoogloea ramigera]|uniref:PEP-CTERM sorting domain-containing protein n=1 Tax=Zoogloea ramigera TaxID=350 RepID=UPI003FA1EB9E